MSVDALSQLRDFFTEKKTVQLKDGNLVMGEHSFPKKTTTIYRSAQGKGKPYMLCDIWFYLSNHTLDLGQYARECVKNKVKTVRKEDQDAMYQYMTGKTDKNDCLDFSLLDAAAEEEEAKVAVKDSGSWTVSDIFTQEKLMENRVTMMQTAKAKDLSHVAKLYVDVVDARKRKHLAENKHSRSRHLSGNTPDAKRAKRSPNSSIPIIIVPQAMTSIINMYNVKDLLDKGKFADPSVSRQENPTKPGVVQFERKSFVDPNKNCKYDVIDNPKSLKKEDWDRVAAVFVTGAEWQFKGWPWQSPAQIFDNVCAFHLHYDDELLNPKIATWRCQRLTVSKIKRYKDRSMVMDFWNHLCSFMSSRNKERGLFF